MFSENVCISLSFRNSIKHSKHYHHNQKKTFTAWQRQLFKSLSINEFLFMTEFLFPQNAPS